MTIIVCPLSRVDELVEQHQPSRVISLLDPDFTFPDLGPAYDGRHLRLRFHDVHEAADNEIAPAAEHVESLLAFLGGTQPGEHLLIHCRAGISRSTAAAFIAACFLNPDVPELDLAVALRRAAPLARPNQVLVALADAAMARDGRMSAAITATGRNLPWTGANEGDVFEMPGT
ncbi:MAG TPA: hypothetical protein VES67_08290 [Vicinamibacterales bacterium]|nr:hypothetical protein [Vicinamibacterales bacterium]